MIGTAIGTLMLIGVIAIMVMRFYNQDIVPMKNNRMWMNTAAYVDYIPTQHTLVLKKRGPELSKAIKILDDRDYKISYKPEEYIFTSVTVGGITTGGVDKLEDITIFLEVPKLENINYGILISWLEISDYLMNFLSRQKNL